MKEAYHGILRPGVQYGLGLGLTFTFIEALKGIMQSQLLFHYQQPLKVILISVVFNLVLGALIGLVAAPLLRLKHRWLWYGFGCVALLAVLHLALPPQFRSMVAFDLIVVGAVALLFAFSLWLAREPVRVRIGVVLGVVGVIVAYAVPRWLAPVDAELDPGRSNAPANAPNVLLIVLDTLRADRVELMGYERETFPWLTAFAPEGATFQRAISAAPWTVPSHGSMFTGLYPSGHGAHHERTYLDESHTTLAEILYRHGWETVVLSANAWLARSTGLIQGFAWTEPTWITWLAPMSSFAYRVAWRFGWLTNDHSGRRVTDAWLHWLETWPQQRPFFACLNYVEPHIPYHQLPRDHLRTFAPEDVTREEVIRASKAVQDAERLGIVVSDEEAQRVRDLYDAAVRYQNDLVAEVVEAVRARGILDQTIVILVSDHGHLLGEHGIFDHNRSLSEYLLWVPLVIRYPPRVSPGLVIDTPVTTAALLPTILDLARLPPAAGIHTRSFAPLFDGNMAEAQSPLLAEQYRDEGEMVAEGFEPRSMFDRIGIRYRSIEDEDGWKLIVDSVGTRWLLRPREDPTELTNLADEHPEVVERLAARLLTLVEAYGLGALDAELSDSGDDVELDPEVREQLRALGYAGS